MNAGALDVEISNMRNSLTTDRLDMSYGELVSMYGRHELIITPDFQRHYRWTLEQKTRLIESILLGIPIPPIYVAEDADGRWELVDGLQRISTILSFFGQLDGEDHFVLSEGDLLPSLKGYSDESLPLKLTLNIRRAVCRVEVIKWNSKWDMRYELFNRLNTGGTPLSGQEIRNCIFRAGLKGFYDFIEEAVEDENFIALTQVKGEKKKQLFDQELVVRFVALVDDWSCVDAPISLYATTFMRNMVRNQSDISAETKERFARTMRILAASDPCAFKMGKVFSPSLYDAISVATANNLQRFENDPRSLQVAIQELKGNSAFKRLRTSAGSTRRTRQQVEMAMNTFS